MTKGLNLGYIGLGQAGCNIANEYAKLGYKAIAINTSSTDLEFLDAIHKNNRLLVSTGVQGAGKNPEVGRKALEDRIEEVYNLVERVFSDDINKLFICAGMGGGTGSGMVSLMAEILTEQGFDTGVITTLPSGIESPRVQLVALSTYEQLTSVEGISNVFIIDNKKASDRIPGIGLNKKYQMLNSSIAKQLDNINKMSTRPSSIAFDAKDLDTVLKARGLAIINQVTIEDVADLKNEITLSHLLKDAISTSLSPSIGNIEATGAAFLFELPKGSSHLINETSIKIMKKELGNPFDVFYGLYEDEGSDKGKMGTLTVLLTGIDMNAVERLTEIESEIEEQEESFTRKFEQQKNSFKGKGSSLLEKFSMEKTVAQKPVKKEGMSALDRLKAKNKK